MTGTTTPTTGTVRTSTRVKVTRSQHWLSPSETFRSLLTHPDTLVLMKISLTSSLQLTENVKCYPNKLGSWVQVTHHLIKKGKAMCWNDSGSRGRCMPALSLLCIGDCMAINPSTDTEPGLDLRLSCGYFSELWLGAHRCGWVAGELRGQVLWRRVCSVRFAAGIISVKCLWERKVAPRSWQYGKKYQAVAEHKSELLLSELWAFPEPKQADSRGEQEWIAGAAAGTPPRRAAARPAERSRAAAAGRSCSRTSPPSRRGTGPRSSAWRRTCSAGLCSDGTGWDSLLTYWAVTVKALSLQSEDELGRLNFTSLGLIIKRGAARPVQYRAVPTLCFSTGTFHSISPHTYWLQRPNWCVCVCVCVARVKVWNFIRVKCCIQATCHCGTTLLETTSPQSYVGLVQSHTA